MLKWYEQTDGEHTGVISSRVRLARNWNAYAFPSKLEEDEAAMLVERLEYGLRGLGSVDGKHYKYVLLQDLSELERKALHENRVFNSTIAAQKMPGGLIISDQEDTNLVLNGTDHIRMQLLAGGLKLEELWEQADRMDDYINQRFPYAFDEKYGYLTSFPTNVGTGLKASVVLHLPALSMGKKFGGLVAEMGRFGAGIRGVYGEGNENYGALYEVFNQKTLGISEQEILALVKKVAMQLSAQERQVRTMAIDKHRIELEDEAYKSYGVLKFARRLTIKDGMIFLSQLMRGLEDGLLKTKEPCSVYRLMLGIQSGNLQRNSQRPLNKAELETARASYLRRELPELL